MAIFWRIPLRGASNAGAVGTDRNSGQMYDYRSMAAAVCDEQLTVVGAVVYHSYGARLFTAQIATHQWIRQREENGAEFICVQR